MSDNGDRGHSEDQPFTHLLLLLDAYSSMIENVCLILERGPLSGTQQEDLAAALRTLSRETRMARAMISEIGGQQEHDFRNN